MPSPNFPDATQVAEYREVAAPILKPPRPSLTVTKEIIKSKVLWICMDCKQICCVLTEPVSTYIKKWSHNNLLKRKQNKKKRVSEAEPIHEHIIAHVMMHML